MSQFVKGNIPWNKGKKGSQVAWNKGLTKKDNPKLSNSGVKKGNTPWNKGKFDLNTYYGIHNWVKQTKGKPKSCRACGNERGIVWANKSNEYKKILDDWVELCHSCHFLYDQPDFGAMEAKYG